MGDPKYYCGVTVVKNIIISYLKEHGFDGLYHDSDCGCTIDDLAPCSESGFDCTPGYKIDTPGEETEFIIGPEKMEVE